ncbi:MAG: beta-galactosidase [Victivallales bacterium]|jgi:beta-galactosidase
MNDYELKPLGNAKISHLRPAKVDRFWFGAPYYPEHWDRETREKDPERMAAAGFNIVRMAEFAWDLMEPKEGIYDFSFFDEIIERLGKKGVMTMLCTPTAAPPRWVSLLYPDTLRVNENCVPMQHGSRQHCCHSNGNFRKFSWIITQKMAEHFKDNPYVAGWQTDNEINCHFSECHCGSCQIEFRKFLSWKYKCDIALLNKSWGNAFWALTYSSFDEIETPRRNKPAYCNPAAELDYFRYISYIATVFQHEQVEILRNSHPKWFVTHNGIFGHIDYRGTFTKDLDFLGYDIYPLFQNDPALRAEQNAYNLDRTRSLSGNFIVPEHQSGPGGQAPYFHDNPEPGEIRNLTYSAIARGADGLLYFRWRTCRFGAEEYWCGILDHDNIPRRRYDEISLIGKEMGTVGKEILGTSVFIDCAVATGDMDANDAHSTYPLGLPDPGRTAGVAHKMLYKSGYAVGCIHPEDDLSGIKLYFIPNWELFNPEWVPRLEKYVEEGGVLVIGARSATRDMNNNVVPETIPGCLRRLAGVSVEEYGKLNMPEKRPFHLKFKDKKIKSETWYEILNLEDAASFAKWSGRHLDGKTAISIRKLGKGRVIYAGTYLSENILKIFMPELTKIANLKPVWPSAPKGVETVVRYSGKKKIWFFINRNDGKVKIQKTPKGNDLISGKKSSGGPIILDRYAVSVISEA